MLDMSPMRSCVRRAVWRRRLPTSATGQAAIGRMRRPNRASCQSIHTIAATSATIISTSRTRLVMERETASWMNCRSVEKRCASAAGGSRPTWPRSARISRSNIATCRSRVTLVAMRLVSATWP
jgi:hypothetical protein